MIQHTLLAAIIAASLGSAPPSSEYLGPVASRTALAAVYSSTVKQAMSHTVHIASEDIGALSLLYPAYYVTATGVETSLSGALVLHVGIEYPIGGAVTEIKWGGASLSSIAAGTNGVSDLTTLHETIPAGALFRVRCWASNAAGLAYTDLIRNTSAGTEFFAYGTTVPDNALSGALTNTSSSSQTAILPLAILGMTTRRTAAAFCDSKGFGAADTYLGAEYVKGVLNRGLLSAGFGTISCARPSVRAEHFVGNAVRQLELAQYVTDIIFQPGMNDLIAGRTAAVIIATLNSGYAKFPGKKLWRVPISPYTNSGNTATVNEVVRTEVNAHIASLGSVIDTNSILEAAGGLWVSGHSTDGIHELRVATVAVATSGVIGTTLGSPGV